MSKAQYVAVTSFVALFSIVGLALYGLPFYYDFMVKEFGWSRAQVTSGNAISKLLVGPLFGFMAGWVVDRFGPRRLMMAGIVMAGVALIGLAHMTSLSMFYAFYLLNAIGYVCGGPLPNQVLLSRWFDKSRGKAMGFAYLGIGIGGYLVLKLSPRAGERVRLARRAAVPRHPHHPARAADGLLRARRAGRAPDRTRRAAPAARRADGRHLQEPGLLPPDARQHVLDRRRRRHQPASEALPQSRPAVLADGGRLDRVDGPRLQHRRASPHGMAGGPDPAQARHAAHLRADRRIDPAALLRALAGRRSTPSRSSSGSASAANT